jgi:hypothetical protein
MQYGMALPRKFDDTADLGAATERFWKRGFEAWSSREPVRQWGS